MIIVNYDTFVQMPIGTVYCEYSDVVFGDLYIKGETINNGKDWFYRELVGNPEFNSDIYTEACVPMKEGKHINPDYDISQRDGMFDYDRQFVVYSKEDIISLINTLKELV